MQELAETDGTLARLLAAAAIDLDADEARHRIRAAAAADGADVEACIEQVVPRAPEALRRHLAELFAAARAEYARPGTIPPPRRLEILRGELKARDLDGLIVPRTDEHRGEYVALRSERLAWLTGFTGSAGLAVVLGNAAVLFVDGRYTLQARAETDRDTFAVRRLVDELPHEWIADNLPRGARLGYDPWLVSAAEAERFRSACERAGGSLVAVDGNPIDAVWTDQPPAPLAPVVPHDMAYAGRRSIDKRRDAAAPLTKDGQDAAVLTATDSIAWLLNLRGADIAFTPIFMAFAVLHADSTVELFVDERKITAAARDSLDRGVTLRPVAAFGEALDALGAVRRTVRVDPDGTAAWVGERLRAAGATVAAGADPCALPKACKNNVELLGFRAAHKRDGVALVRFLAWLAATAANGTVTEIEAAERLEGFRRENDRFRGMSFPTISAAGSNGAVVHYRVDEASNRRLEPGSLYLVDSGAQYVDGTTDVTRTVAIGAPTPEMCERFTRVLKGNIALSTARFPRGTTGSQLDLLARRALWEVGLDFDHGTGHGIGSYLGVHEGPQRISKVANRIALQPGMVISNEPGYYKAGSYGIRIENLIAVSAEPGRPEDELEMLEFEVLTLAPIDRALIVADLLDAGEAAWLDTYHQRVRETLSPLVDDDTRAWLAQATRPLAG